MNIICKDFEISISERNSKMGKVSSFSVMPIITCRKDAPCKKECYAVKLVRLRQRVKQSYEKNTSALTLEAKEDIISTIVGYIKLKKVKLFRWNVSGDFGIPGYFEISMEVAKQCPETKFLAFTKFYEISNQKIPDNYNVVYSCWGNFMPENWKKLPCAFFFSGSEEIPKTSEECHGDCANCQKCFDLKNGRSVFFHKH